MKAFVLGVVSTAFVVAASGALADNAMCAGRETVAQWDPDQEAVKAAPKNHRVLLENDELRVLEVTVRPGERENAHHHRWPSVMIIDARPKYINYDKDGNEIPPAVKLAAAPEMPLVVKLPAQATHDIHNLDSYAFHAIRVEYKKLCP